MMKNFCPIKYVDQLVVDTNGLFSDKSIKQIREHLTCHKYYLGLKIKRSPSWCETLSSYNNEIFIPLYKSIYSWDFDVAFPKTKKEILYFQLATHLYYLRQSNKDISIREAAFDFCHIYGNNKKGKMLVNLLHKIS